MSDALQALIDKEQVLEVVNRLFVSTDRRDWAAVRSCLADPVVLDMSSMTGGEPMSMTPQQVADGWEQGLRSLDAIHHQTGNATATVDGDHAMAFCYGTATHYRKTASGRNVLTFVGSYGIELARRHGVWKITLFRFNLKYIDGNLDLEKDG
ncbi:MAG TPA: nuclear transport factor 2 family protein [Holophagaceae bacterium]|nr:nuclear transport factor 2 family protein [Holophagaceae bacterium]